MAGTQSDLVVWYRLETEFFQDHVRHTRYVEGPKNREKKVKEDWSNCQELGKGGFGVVHKQIQKNTGYYRAVKTIDKRVSSGFDYSRELLVMAILAKRPSLFVEFLGWFEEPGTLYIAMEYLEEGDLTNHIGTPLPQETVRTISKQILVGLEVMHQQGMAHRDLKPENIFVVSMSPAWVKLGDFGISKRIPAGATTTFHTQVSTPVYSAPEVLGLDANSETSDYTNSVDIWSLGCVIYELFVGEKLFASEGQLLRYYLRKWSFPEDKLKALSPPTGDVGTLLVKSMLSVQPEDRPTAAGALRHAWFIGPDSDNEDSGDEPDGTTQSADEVARSRKSENELATHSGSKKRMRGGMAIVRGDTKYTTGHAALPVNLGWERGSSLTTPKPGIDTSVMKPLHVASSETSRIQPESLNPGLMPHNFRAIRYKGPKALRKKQISDMLQAWPQDLRQAIPQRQTRHRGQMARWNTPQSANSTPPLLVRRPHGRPSHRPSVPGRLDSGEAIRKYQRAKPGRIPLLIPAVGEKAGATITRPPIQHKTLILNRVFMLVGILILARILGGNLMLTRTLTGILMLAGALMLARILGGTLAMSGTATPEGVQIADRIPFSDATQTSGSRTRIRLKERYRQRKGRAYRK